MKSKIILFTGLILMVVGAVVYFVIDSGNASLTVNGQLRNDADTINIVKYSVGGGIAGLGLLFLIFGFIGIARNAKLNKQKIHILKTGTETTGTVTFVDKNYSFLVNNKPVYSIVEYTYQDKSGNNYTRRITSLNSDIVIRNSIVVGNTIPVKYAKEDASLSIILLNSPAKAPSPVVVCKYCNSKFSINKYDACPKCGAS